MGCQKEIIKQIVNKGADYLLAVKGNQKKLYKALNNQFNMSTFTKYEWERIQLMKLVMDEQKLG